jgi:hypothetical protein
MPVMIREPCCDLPREMTTFVVVVTHLMPQLKGALLPNSRHNSAS